MQQLNIHPYEETTKPPSNFPNENMKEKLMTN